MLISCSLRSEGIGDVFITNPDLYVYGAKTLADNGKMKTGDVKVCVLIQRTISWGQINCSCTEYVFISPPQSAVITGRNLKWVGRKKHSQPQRGQLTRGACMLMWHDLFSIQYEFWLNAERGKVTDNWRLKVTELNTIRRRGWPQRLSVFQAHSRLNPCTLCYGRRF